MPKNSAVVQGQSDAAPFALLMWAHAPEPPVLLFWLLPDADCDELGSRRHRLRSKIVLEFPVTRLPHAEDAQRQLWRGALPAAVAQQVAADLARAAPWCSTRVFTAGGACS